MKKKAAGIIAYTEKDGKLLFLAGHPGGNPQDYWTLFKGEMADGEETKDTAVREFCEETGIGLDDGVKDRLVCLGWVCQSRVKDVCAYALYVNYDDIDLNACHSNMADNCNWAEIDKYAWFEYDEIVPRTHKTHKVFYDEINKNHKQWKH